MNKQEYIGKLKKLLEAPSEIEGSNLDIIYNCAIKRAIHLAEYLDEKQLKYEKQQLINEIEKVKFKIPNNEYKKGYNNGINSSILCVYDMKETTINNTNNPHHYQGTIQPIDLINAQDLNFNLGNVVKYVCSAGKKEGENTLSDLEKAKDYINFEIERVKKWQVFI